MKKQVLCFGAMIMAFALLPLRAPASDLVATLGDRGITRDDVHHEISQKVRNKAFERILDRLLVLDELKRQKISVTDEEIEAAYKERAAEFAEDSRNSSLEDVLQERYGATLAEYKDRVIRLDISLRKLLNRKLSINDADVFNFYFMNRDRYSEPEKVRISHIFINPHIVEQGEKIILPTAKKADWDRALDRALKIRREARNAESFADACRKYSDGPKQDESGENTGWLERNSGAEKAIENIAFALKDSEVSEPIKTLSGYHLVFRHEYKPEKQIPYSEIRERLRRDYEEWVRNTQYSQLTEILREKALKEGRLKFGVSP